jgi:hypothetical protein
MSDRREVMVWFADPALESALAWLPLSGVTRHDAGDYVAVVEANVSPTSKFNLVVSRRDAVSVDIDPTGQATTDLNLSWQNNSMLPGEPYESIRSYSTSRVGQYGAFVKVLTPATSSLLQADGSATVDVDGAELVQNEVGKNAFGNYLLMDPGPSSLHYRWSVPGAATQTDGLWTYRLTLQKQPGVSAVPTAVSVSLPEGAIVETVGGAALAADGTIVADTSLERDGLIVISYRLP